MITEAGIEVDTSKTHHAHGFCLRSIDLAQRMANRKVTKGEEEEAKEEAYSLFLQRAHQDLVVDKKPILFKKLYWMFASEFKTVFDSDFDFDYRDWFRYRIEQWAVKNGITIFREGAYSMYYHGETDFLLTYTDALKLDLEKSPDSDSSAENCVRSQTQGGPGI
jgi:hypothetical protein